MIREKLITALFLTAILLSSWAYRAYAATNATAILEQIITPGVVSTDIRDAGGSVITNPIIAMNSLVLSTTSQVSTGVFGTSSQRITVDNPGGANNGWSLSLNATNPATDVWTSGFDTYKFNATTAANGQLTVDPTAGTISYTVGGSAGISLGMQATFNSVAPITLVSAAALSSDLWNGYFTGIGLSQTVPAGQPAGTYTLPMTQTLTVV